jgi:starch synthase
MKVIQAVNGVFHHFELARQLEAQGHTAKIFTTFPWQRIKREGIPQRHVRSFPWVHTPQLLVSRYWQIPGRLNAQINHLNFRSFDAWITRNLKPCDAYIALSGSGLKSGQRAQQLGSKYICDRGSSHIRYQDSIVTEEYRIWGFEQPACDPWMIDREEAEYAKADAITVASEFSRRSFLEMGVPAKKVNKIPYGVKLDSFRRTGEPAKNSFDILFAGSVSLRKGIPYLLEAFQRFRYPGKRLRLIGNVEPSAKAILAKMDLTGVEILGRMPQHELVEYMSKSHVLVLPSIEDGFGLVITQAMACGCPVISSEHTGGPDLLQDGIAGFVVPIRSAKAIAAHLQQMADDPGLRQRMSEAALLQVQSVGGWHDYGAQYIEFLKTLTRTG